MYFVVFRSPSLSWDGIEWIYELTEDRENHLDFSLVEAKNYEEAKRIYFENVLFQKDGNYFIASDCACRLCEDFSEEELKKRYGEEDGKILWAITTEFDDKYPDADRETIYDERIEQVSENTIKELCFEREYYDIAVAKITNKFMKPKPRKKPMVKDE